MNEFLARTTSLIWQDGGEVEVAWYLEGDNVIGMHDNIKIIEYDVESGANRDVRKELAKTYPNKLYVNRQASDFCVIAKRIRK